MIRPRGRIAPVVLVCGIVAAIALAVPSLGPAALTSFADSATDVDASAAGAVADTSVEETPTAEEAEPTAVVQLGVDGVLPSEVAPSPPAPAAETSAPAPEPVATGSSPEAEVAETDEEEEEEPASSAADPAPVAETAAPAAVAAPAAPGVEGQVIALVNQQRAAAGCGAVAADEGLASLARAFSADMRDRGFFAHTDPDGLSPFDRGDRAGVTVLAENIAYGQPDAASVMDDWMNSPGHRANILNCSYTRLGVGIADGAGGPWWTQDFA